MPKETNWLEERKLLLSIVATTELIPMTKWGMDIYTINGKDVMSFHGFKNHYSIWFNNGVFLKDKHNLLSAATETTKAMRQWKVTDVSAIKPSILRAYIEEAIQNEAEGKVWKPQKMAEIAIPTYFEAVFKTNKGLKIAFEKLTPYKQKEYLNYITSAKKIETNLKRMDQVIPKIMEGKGINDQYK